MSEHKVLKSDGKNIVYNVYKYFCEKEPNKLHEDIIKNCVCATGVSRATVFRIIKEKKITKGLKSPPKRRRTNSVTEIDDFMQCAIRRIIYEFQNTEKKQMTIKILLQKLKTDFDFRGSTWAVAKILKNLGFRFKKTRNNRRLLCEKPEIQALRVKYLRAISKFRSENKNIVYVDETYLHEGHVTGKQWADDSNKGFHSSISKGRRLIIIHGGGEAGFVPNALVIFKSGSKSGDYHDEMNFENFSKWLQQNLLPNLPPESVIVLDNAAYHNVRSNKIPTMAANKREMVSWLLKNQIPFDSNMLKVELYHIIKTHKEAIIKFKINEIIEAAGHHVLRLPPYHPDLNPIEMIWGTIKSAVASRNTTGKLNDVQNLALEEFSKITAADWMKRCDHVRDIENKYKEIDLQFDHIIENIKFIIDLDTDSSETEYTSDEEM